MFYSFSEQVQYSPPSPFGWGKEENIVLDLIYYLICIDLGYKNMSYSLNKKMQYEFLNLLFMYNFLQRKMGGGVRGSFQPIL
jgi:hypothetical protein